MNATIPSDQFNTFFGLLPWVVGLLILLVAYIALHNQSSKTVPVGQTFACSNCGRRGRRGHMVPVTHAGAISWQCAHCAKSQH